MLNTRFLLALLNHVTCDYFKQYDLWWGHYWLCDRHDLAIWTPSKTKMSAFTGLNFKTYDLSCWYWIKGSFLVLLILCCLLFFYLRILIISLLCNVPHTTTHKKLMLIRRFYTSSLRVTRETISHTWDVHLHPVLRSCCQFDNSNRTHDPFSGL